MLKEPKLIAIAIAIALTCNHANAQQDLKLKVDELFQAALKLERKKIDSVKIISKTVRAMSLQARYDLGELKAKILAAHFFVNKFKMDSSNIVVGECESFLTARPELAQSEERGYVYFYRGEIAYRRMQLEEAERNASEALKIFTRVDNAPMMANAYSQLGIVEILRVNDFKALSFLLMAYRIKHEIGAESRLETDHIAEIYRNMGQYEKALQFYRKLATIPESHELPQHLINDNLEIGKIKFLQGEQDSALFYFKRGREIAVQNNFPTLTCAADYSIADLYSTQSLFRESNTLVLPLLKRTFSPHSDMSVSVRILISTNYLKLKQYDSAMLLARQGMATALDHDSKERISSLAKIISEIFEARHNADSAFHYFKIHYALNDSLYSQENQRKLSTLYADVENLAKQQEIDLLEKQSALEQAQNKALIIAIVLGTTSFVFILVSLVLQYRNRKRKHMLETIELQQEIELKKKDLHEQALRMIYVNNELTEVEESLRKIKTVSNGGPKEVQELLSSIHINKSLEKEWDNFTDYFGSVHVGFYEKFNGLFPNVTLSEKRLAGLIRMNMTNSEIAGILNIESSSVKTAKYRLKKKVGLNDEQDIHSFLQKF